MAVIHKTGDLFTTDAFAIGHGVNGVGVMGAGVALEFRARFPKMYAEYQSMCERGYNGIGEVFLYKENETLICNMFTQVFPGSNAKLTALRMALDKTLEALFVRGIETLAIPRIGSGIGGLKWEDTLAMIERVASDYPDVDVEIWSLQEAS
jgi:O-acetyl-ADP-ribose deacetylase (regulator of RNase III)